MGATFELDGLLPVPDGPNVDSVGDGKEDSAGVVSLVSDLAGESS